MALDGLERAFGERTRMQRAARRDLRKNVDEMRCACAPEAHQRIASGRPDDMAPILASPIPSGEAISRG